VAGSYSHGKVCCLNSVEDGERVRKLVSENAAIPQEALPDLQKVIDAEAELGVP